LDSVKGVNTETEIKTKFNKPEDVALLQAYLVLSGNLKTEKGVKEIDGAAGPKTLSAVQDYRKKETPRQEQVQKQQNQRQEIIKRQESIDDTNYVNEVVRDLKKQYKNGVDVSKNPVITITMAGNLTKKIYDTYTCTVSEFNQLQKVLVTFNLHDYTKVINSKNIFDKKLG
jgi:peptidoglycan hydrolase-like protein with peptidoglycan-binding domain